MLDRLVPAHRAALTLRYLDDLPVPQVAALLDRTLHATEALLVRARAAFRRAYESTEQQGGAPMTDPERPFRRWLARPSTRSSPTPPSPRRCATACAVPCCRSRPTTPAPEVVPDVRS